MKILLRLAFDRRGEAAAEYAMLLALVGAAVAFATVDLADAIGCAIERTSLIITGEEDHKVHQYGHSDPRGNALGQRKTC